MYFVNENTGLFKWNWRKKHKIVTYAYSIRVYGSFTNQTNGKFQYGRKMQSVTFGQGRDTPVNSGDNEHDSLETIHYLWIFQ